MHYVFKGKFPNLSQQILEKWENTQKDKSRQCHACTPPIKSTYGAKFYTPGGCIKGGGGIKFLPRAASKYTPPPPSPEKCLLTTNGVGGGVYNFALENWPHLPANLLGCLLPFTHYTRTEKYPKHPPVLRSTRTIPLTDWDHAGLVWKGKRSKAENGEKMENQMETALIWRGAKNGKELDFRGSFPLFLHVRAIFWPFFTRVLRGALSIWSSIFSPFPAFGCFPCHTSPAWSQLTDNYQNHYNFISKTIRSRNWNCSKFLRAPWGIIPVTAFF